jgi:hypothetical protein
MVLGLSVSSFQLPVFDQHRRANSTACGRQQELGALPLGNWHLAPGNWSLKMF